MDNLKKNVLDITNNYYYYYLMNLKNVHGVGLGYKYINNIDTLEPCIHVLIEKKIYSKYLAANNIIPKTYMGIKTDVIETPRAMVTFSNRVVPKIFQKFRPLEGGIGISVKGVAGDGTIGCIVQHKNLLKTEYFILGNNHVLADDNKVSIGTSIIQPSVYFGGSEDKDVVAYL